MLTLPASLNSQLLVKSKIEDPEVVTRNQEIIKTKSVSELSQIRDLSDFPIPAGIENFFKQNPVKNSGETNEKMWIYILIPPIQFTKNMYLGVKLLLNDQPLRKVSRSPSMKLYQNL